MVINQKKRKEKLKGKNKQAGFIGQVWTRRAKQIRHCFKISAG